MGSPDRPRQVRHETHGRCSVTNRAGRSRCFVPGDRVESAKRHDLGADSSAGEPLDELTVLERDHADIESLGVDRAEEAQERDFCSTGLRRVVHDVHSMRAHVRKSSNCPPEPRIGA